MIELIVSGFRLVELSLFSDFVRGVELSKDTIVLRLVIHGSGGKAHTNTLQLSI